MSALLHLAAVFKRHGERTLLQIDELSLEAGCAYVLTGENGAGKTTLLRVLAGLESAQVASAIFDGWPVSLSPYASAMRATVVYVHQHPVLFSTSVAANVGYGLAARRVPAAQAAHQVHEAMVWAGVAHLAGRAPATLSGGEKQRVALARAKVLQPKLLLLDEPTANLDGAAREQVIALIPTLVASGATFVIACHDRDLIAVPGVRRLKLRDGRIEYKGEQ